MKILVVSKVTAYERAHRRGAKLSPFREQTLKKRHDAHHIMLQKVRSEIQKHGLYADYELEEELDRQNSSQEYDYILSCGGDGTFLSVAQHFPDKIIIGINTDKSKSVKKGSIGALTNVDKTNVTLAFDKLVAGDFSVEEWPRLCATVNGKLIDQVATNDIFFGNPISYSTCHFSMKYGKRREHFHGSSGLVASTGIGSTAWYRNEGGTPFTRDLLAFGFVVRAPHMKRMPAFTQGMVPQDQTIKVQCHDDGYVLSFDSKEHAVELQHGDMVRIGINREHPVKVVRFN